MPYPYSYDHPDGRHDYYHDDCREARSCGCGHHAGGREHCGDHCRSRECDILTPLGSGTLRTRGEWVCIDLPGNIPGRRPLKLTAVTAEGVSEAALDPACACQSEYGLGVRVTIPLSLTVVDCRGYQHASCSSISVCVPITHAACSKLPRNASVRVRACVSLVEPACVDECGRFVEAMLNIRVDVYIVGRFPEKCGCKKACPSPLPWYPQPPRMDHRGEWRYEEREDYDW